MGFRVLVSLGGLWLSILVLILFTRFILGMLVTLVLGILLRGFCGLGGMWFRLGFM